MSKLRRRLVVKIGSNVIAGEDGRLSETIMSQLVTQVAELKRAGASVVVVTSGAVAAGRELVKLKDGTSAVVRRQLLAAAGQVSLMHTYARLFAPHGLVCAQVLATKEDFRDRHHYINMRNCLDGLLHEGVVPVVNENDVVAVSELMFSDNDELAGLIAAMLGADTMFLLTSVDGIYDGPPADAGAKVIPVIDIDDHEWRAFLRPGTSSLGRGGMRTKCEIARKAAAMGTATFIGNGRTQGILTRIVAGERLGTEFPRARRKSNVKRRLAHTPPRVEAAVVINEGARLALLQGRAVSLLPIGVVAVKGEFQKGDVIAIRGERGRTLGVGMAQFDSDKAREWLGQKGHRPLIHYNHLFLDPQDA